MTNEEREFAKSRIEYLLKVDDFLVKHDREALEMAIQALSQEPCDDAISREAVIKGIEELKKSPWATANRSHGYEYLITEALDVVKDLCVKALPSVTQKSGKWINDECGNVICSECKRFRRDCRYGHTNYCNHCGARMESEEISERNMKMWEELFKAESEGKK